jgi:hypothetical protein
MHISIQFEDRVSRSRASTKENPRPEICDRLSRTRVSSQRQLPTDHDYAVPTREYQLDQSSTYLPRLLLSLSLKYKSKNHPTHVQLLTGHTISISG